MDDKTIEGRGQIPFVYEAYEEHPPWLMLKIGEDLQIIDCGSGAFLCRPGDGTLIASRPRGTFFKGLARPWMGMHTMNIVRRDAVEHRVWFETTPGSGKGDVIVTLMHDNEGRKTDLVYTIDAEKDIIKDIRFDVQNRTRGSLVFEHISDVDGIGDQYTEPTVSRGGQLLTQANPPAILWLVSLAQGGLSE